MDLPLTITSIMRYGTSVFGDGEVVTWTGDGTRRRTYAEAGRRAARLANALRGLGVDGDQRVGTFMWNNAEHLEAYLAVPSMGAVLHTLNIRLAAAEVGYIATHAEDQVVIVDASLVPKFAEILPSAPTVKHVIVTGGPLAETPGTDQLTGVVVHSYEDLLAAEPDAFDWPSIDERSAAAMCYTSGTTGHPKGVVYSHRSTFLHTFGAGLSDCIGLTERDCLLPVVPMFHAMAWGQPYVATMVGATQALPDRFLDPASLVELIRQEGVTVAAGVPTVWIALLQYLEKTGTRLPSVRTVVCGGSALPPALMEGMARQGLRMLHAWGMTETSPLGSVGVVKSTLGKTQEDEMRVRLKQGLPSAGVEARLVSLDTGKDLPWDGQTIGELQVRGPWVATGYYRGADPDRFTADGWLRTGDVVTIDPEGYIQIADRVKDLVKSGGEWISSVELESALMGHPKVLEAAVVGVPHPKWQERPIAFVVPKPDQRGAVTQEEILGFLRPKVAKWWLPDEIRFIDEIPKTSVGKFDKKLLREQAVTPAVAGVRPSE